jgi:hypothetical protein
MCLMFYLGTDTPIARDPYEDGKNRAIYIEDLQPSATGALRHFSKRCVCYVSSYEGCGCGFQHPGELCKDDTEMTGSSQRSREQLAALLRAALRTERHVELFVCWAGDEDDDMEYRRTLSPDDLLDSETSFREREFIIFA